MKKFLQEVASSIEAEFGSDLSGQILVFPNRRSSLFFTRYLANIYDKPVWTPKVFTINELVSSSSSLSKPEALTLIFELYTIYNKVRKASDSFDEFYFWGEMLLDDFDDIDKYLVDADKLFQNLEDIHEIDEKFGGYDKEIIEIIRKFWINFDLSKMTSEKSDFLAVWKVLPDIYNSFRESLRSKGFAYDGMIIRDLVEKIQSGFEWIKPEAVYHFVGFNALNRCEQILLDYLKRKGKARFYWDYDDLYVNQVNHEAGLFIRDNIERYGNSLSIVTGRDALVNRTGKKMDWKVINAPSDVAQAKLIPSILKDFELPESQPDKTAIVLADENMLTPVLNSIPASIDDINITMGFPLHQTPVYSLIGNLIRLQKNIRIEDGVVSFYYNDVLNILKHQYLNILSFAESRELIAQIREFNMIRVPVNRFEKSKLHRLVFKAVDEARELNGYIRDILLELMGILNDDKNKKGTHINSAIQAEYIYCLLISLNQLAEIIENSNIEFGAEIFGRILDKVIRKIVVPFSGEPLSGLQVMGILETRLLDFDNLIILSANEGVLPKGSAQNSYIPYNLRVAFGLPTVQHQDSIYAYYFYRLLQRGKKIRFVYNSSSAGIKTGEMSRFLLQLKYSDNLKPDFIDSRFLISPSKRFSDSIKRDYRINDIINHQFSSEGARGLSPSAVNTWINCQMKFYYRYVAKLKEHEDVAIDIDSPLFGNILHESMSNIYSGFLNAEITRDKLEQIRDDGDYIKNVVNDAFISLFHHNKKAKITGRNIVVVTVIESIIKQILLVDSRISPFKIIGLEKRYSITVPVELGDKTLLMPIAGVIDRVDIVEGVTRILDYKSGNDNLSIRQFSDIFSYNIRDRNSAAFQTLLYCELYLGESPGSVVRPSLYPVRQIFSDGFSDQFVIGKGDHGGAISSYLSLRDDFLIQLKKILIDIINPDLDIEMTRDKQKCKYCPYAHLCDREE